jgi:hypothetical protein
MHHDRNVSTEINSLEQLSRAELRVLWEREFAGKAPRSLGRDILALGIAYARQERRYGEVISKSSVCCSGIAARCC